ncbi:MAG: tRNA pseudouridine(38-40) synthase TruA [Christensenellales bacterium]|jgi:tRNA pseudouridine38-40 synthase
MTRIAMTIEYGGAAYAGWQRQKNAVTVQQRVEEALEALTGACIRVTGASRTDAGVHAKAQVAHFDSPGRIPPEKYAYALNTKLPEDIRITGSWQAEDDFHARFMAVRKTYGYLICNRPHASALFHDMSWHVPVKLDMERMRRAAQDLPGTHDFAAFCATGGAARTTVRTVHKLDIGEPEDGFIRIEISGNAFLYNMVRIIAGTLAGVGKGDLPADIIRRMLETRDRKIGGITAPAAGLTLEGVEYARALPDWVEPQRRNALKP